MYSRKVIQKFQETLNNPQAHNVGRMDTNAKNVGTGMVGGAIYRRLKEKGYGNPINGGSIFTPKRKELDLLNLSAVEEWFKINNPTVVIIAAAKVGGIWANSTNPTEFLLENLKIQTNIIETCLLYTSPSPRDRTRSRMPSSA